MTVDDRGSTALSLPLMFLSINLGGIAISRQHVLEIKLQFSSQCSFRTYSLCLVSQRSNQITSYCPQRYETMKVGILTSPGLAYDKWSV